MKTSGHHPTVTYREVRGPIGKKRYTLKSAMPFASQRYVEKVRVYLDCPIAHISPDRQACLTLWYTVPRYASTAEIDPWLAGAMEQLDRDYLPAAREIADRELGETLDYFNTSVESVRDEK